MRSLLSSGADKTRAAMPGGAGSMLVALCSQAVRPWMGTVVGLATLALIVPNHAPPWMSFVQELLAACALALLAIGVLCSAQDGVAWRAPELLTAGLVLVVGVQFAFGLIESVQTAWMPALYLSGVMLAMHTGSALECRRPGAPLAVALLPMLLAGMVSVGLQLIQWLVLAPGEGTTWVFRAVGGRPAANLGQPNVLATVLVLGLLGLFAAWRCFRCSGRVAALLAFVPMAGLAMSQSRTGLINALIVGGALLAWHWHNRALRRVLLVQMLVLPALYLGYGLLALAPGAGGSPGLATARLEAGLRPAAWRLFAFAVLERPFLGYGWGQTFAAQLAVAPALPPLKRVFLGAHNLWLELALWGGLPIAAAVAGGTVVGFRRAIRLAADDGSRLLILTLCALLVHAMVESPLTYAYLLLPGGIVVGALGQRLRFAAIWRAPRWLGVSLMVLTLAAMALTVRDYLGIEQSFRLLLLEKAHIQVLEDRAPPQVLALTSLRDLIVFSRIEPASGMSDRELEWMTQVVRAHPSADGFSRVAQAMAMNGRPAEAQHWVDQLCRVFLPQQCAAQAEAWAAWLSQGHDADVVRWPL